VCVCVSVWRAKSENGKVRVDGRQSDTHGVIIASLRRVCVLFFIFDASGVHAELTHFLSLSSLRRQSSDESKRLTSEVDEWEPGWIWLHAARLLSAPISGSKFSIWCGRPPKLN